MCHQAAYSSDISCISFIHKASEMCGLTPKSTNKESMVADIIKHGERVVQPVALSDVDDQDESTYPQH